MGAMRCRIPGIVVGDNEAVRKWHKVKEPGMGRSQWRITASNVLASFFTSLDTLSFVCISLVIIHYCNMRFLLDRLHLPLDPQYFDAEVITEEARANLSHSGGQTAGTPSPSQNSSNPASYKPARNGAGYVQVTMKGMGYCERQSRMVVWPIFLAAVLTVIRRFVKRITGNAEALPDS
jgi:hypothetical protein